MNNNTLVAISTASGVGAISIVRMTGEDALKIAYKMISKDKLIARMATLCKVYENSGDLVDEALVIYFENPFYYLSMLFVKIRLVWQF